MPASRPEMNFLYKYLHFMGLRLGGVKMWEVIENVNEKMNGKLYFLIFRLSMLNALTWPLWTMEVLYLRARTTGCTSIVTYKFPP